MPGGARCVQVHTYRHARTRALFFGPCASQEPFSGAAPKLRDQQTCPRKARAISCHIVPWLVLVYVRTACFPPLQAGNFGRRKTTCGSLQDSSSVFVKLEALEFVCAYVRGHAWAAVNLQAPIQGEVKLPSKALYLSTCGQNSGSLSACRQGSAQDGPESSQRRPRTPLSLRVCVCSSVFSAARTYVSLGSLLVHRRPL